MIDKEMLTLQKKMLDVSIKNAIEKLMSKGLDRERRRSIELALAETSGYKSALEDILEILSE